MFRTQIYLTERQRDQLALLCEATGKKQSELVREAIDRLIESASAVRRDSVIREAAGVWKDRSDLPDLRSLRDGWDR